MESCWWRPRFDDCLNLMTSGINIRLNWFGSAEILVGILAGFPPPIWRSSNRFLWFSLVRRLIYLFILFVFLQGFSAAGTRDGPRRVQLVDPEQLRRSFPLFPLSLFLFSPQSDTVKRNKRVVDEGPADKERKSKEQGETFRWSLAEHSRSDCGATSIEPGLTSPKLENAKRKGEIQTRRKTNLGIKCVRV